MTAPQRETVKLVTVPNTLAECQQYCEVLKAEVLRLRAAQREAGEAMREKIIALIMERDGRMRTDTLAAIRALPVEAKGPHGQPK